jgi:hypothetical protein
VQLLTRSNRHAGCMTCGPGPPCWARWSRRGTPTWHGCMPPAWLSALSPAGLGESGGVLVTAGGCMHHARVAVWLLLPWIGLHGVWGPAPAPWGGENLGACWRRLNPQRLRTQVGRVAFKRGSDPLGGQPCLRAPLMHRVFPPSEPPGGGRPESFCLVVGGTQLRGSWHLSAIVRLQGFSSRSPAASPRRWSPKTVTPSFWVGRSKPGCDLGSALSFKNVHHPCWGGERGEPGLYLPRGSAGHLLFQLLVVETIL